MTDLPSDFPPAVLTTLKQTFGFDALRPGQAEVMSPLLAGRSTLAIFPTGAGKSLCYQLPALLLDGLTVVVSPLIALMKDQIDFLHSHEVPAARIDSSLTADEARDVWTDLHDGRLKLLYIAPERFQNERFLARLRGVPIAMLAVDEAHCISEWGHNFRPDYLKLAGMARVLGVQRVLALTATATPAVADDICRAFGIDEADRVHTGFHRPNLFLATTPVTRAEREDALVRRLRACPPGAGIIYVTLQATAERVAKRLQAEGMPARAYHAGLDADRRKEVQEWFMAEPDAIVAATIAFGMGIDKADIRTVMHFNLPKSLENYAQEIGRAGRDGLPSRCELLACPDDATTLENFTYGDTPTADAVRGLVREVLDQGPRFDVSRYNLSRRHDLRPLVVATLLTYLELEGVLATTAPFYDRYSFQPQRSSKEMLADHSGDARAFLAALLAHSVKARTWFHIDVTATAEALGQPRERVVRALDGLQHAGNLIVKVSGLRHGYRVVEAPDDVDALAGRLATRFEESEARDIARVGRVLALVSHPGCLTAELLGYFGETLDGPCGHCDRCAGEARPELPIRPHRSFTEAERTRVRDVVAEGHAALAGPRQLARFLCGLPSPATSRGRPSLRRHPAWGYLSDLPFADVLTLASEA